MDRLTSVADDSDDAVPVGLRRLNLSSLDERGDDLKRLFGGQSRRRATVQQNLGHGAAEVCDVEHGHELPYRRRHRLPIAFEIDR